MHATPATADATKSPVSPLVPAPTVHDHVFIDGSNLFIEGMRLSSQLRSGDRTAPVHAHQDFDMDFRIDLRRLHGFLGCTGSPVRPLLVGSQSENSNLVFESAGWCGFETIVYPRDANNREKKVDATIILRAVLAALDGTPDTTSITLVAGDCDYVPMVKALWQRGYRVEVAFWSHGSRELREAADRFIPLDPVIDMLRYTPVARRPAVAC